MTATPAAKTETRPPSVRPCVMCNGGCTYTLMGGDKINCPVCNGKGGFAHHNNVTQPQ